MRTSSGFRFIGLCLFVSCAWATPGHAVSIEVGSTSVAPGANGVILVKLRTEGQAVKGVINEVHFGSVVEIESCQVNPVFNASGSVSFLPDQCNPGTTCSSVRAVIAVIDGTIADNTELYACTVMAAANAIPAQYELGCQEPSASDPAGGALTATCSSGFVEVTGGGACLGDKDQTSSIEAADVVATIRCFAEDDISLNSAADGNNSSSCEANEVVQVIDNFANDECEPFVP